MHLSKILELRINFMRFELLYLNKLNFSDELCVTYILVIYC